MQDIYRMMEERSSREFAPEGEFDKQAWAERKQSERQEAFDRADAAALRANSDPAALETYMRVAAQLPHHSATNILLIADRMPNATRVGTAEHWRRQGASVRRGQKAIPIIEPVMSYMMLAILESAYPNASLWLSVWLARILVFTCHSSSRTGIIY